MHVCDQRHAISLIADILCRMYGIACLLHAVQVGVAVHRHHRGQKQWDRKQPVKPLPYRKPFFIALPCAFFQNEIDQLPDACKRRQMQKEHGARPGDQHSAKHQRKRPSPYRKLVQRALDLHAKCCQKALDDAVKIRHQRKRNGYQKISHAPPLNDSTRNTR